MNKLEKLHNVCQKEGIIIDHATLRPSILGLYIHEESLPPIISLNKIILNDRLKTIDVLAEELGHHFTTIGNYTKNAIYFRDKLYLNKIEEKALRWACKFLISDEELEECVSNCIDTHEMAEHLDVSHEMLLNRIRIYSLEKSSSVICGKELLP